MLPFNSLALLVCFSNEGSEIINTATLATMVATTSRDLGYHMGQNLKWYPLTAFSTLSSQWPTAKRYAFDTWIRANCAALQVASRRRSGDITKWEAVLPLSLIAPKA